MRQAVRPQGRRPLRRAALALTALPFAAVAAWFLAGLAGALIPSGGAPPAPGTAFHLVAGPIHYDFLLPADARTRAAFGFAAEAGVRIDAPDTEWILIGWGARDFYTTAGTYADITAGPVWRAVTGDRGVLRIDALPAVDTQGLATLSLDPARYRRLLAAIAASRTGGRVPGGFTATDAFFEAGEGFDALRTCNVWVGEMLRAAGLRFGRWTPTPQSLRLSVLRWG